MDDLILTRAMVENTLSYLGITSISQTVIEF